VKPKESSLKSGKSPELQGFYGPGKSKERKKRTRYLSQMAVRLSHEKQIPLKDVIEELEKQIILCVLNEVEGSQKDAAEILGTKYTTLNEKLKRYGIRVKRVSKILLCALFLCWNFRALGPANDGLVKKARETVEIINCQNVIRLLTPAVLEEPEKSGAAPIQLHKAVQDRFSPDDF